MRIPSSPIPIKDRNSMVFLQYGNLDVKDGAFVLIDENGVRIQIPIGGIACIMLENIRYPGKKENIIRKIGMNPIKSTKPSVLPITACMEFVKLRF